MIKPTCEQFHKWKLNSMAPVTHVRMDGAGENKKLQTRSDLSDWKLNLKFEITTRNTPQQNNLVELGFTTLANCGRAMMNQANVPLSVCYKVFKEAFTMATYLDGLMLVKVQGKEATHYIHFFGANPKLADHLRTWGEAGTVKKKVKATPKIANRGVQRIFIGYTIDHTQDTYWMWDPTTSRVHETRDVIWMKRMFYGQETFTNNVAIVNDNIQVTIPQHKAGESNEPGESKPLELEPANNSLEESEPIDDVDDDKLESELESDSLTGPTPVGSTRSGQTIMKPTRLIEESSAIMPDLQQDLEEYEIKLTCAEEQYYEAMTILHEGEFIPEEVNCVESGIGGGFVNTKELHLMKYKQAMATKDVKHWE
jgi:hypothetical protein